MFAVVLHEAIDLFCVCSAPIKKVFAFKREPVVNLVSIPVLISSFVASLNL